MSGRPTQPKLRATRPSWSVVVLRLMLLVSAWQGPIPWCHSHASSLSQDASAWLVDHLCIYHASGESARGKLLGWHIHADFPRPPIEDSDEPRDASPLEFPVNLFAGGRAVGGFSAEPPADWTPSAPGTGGDCEATRLDRSLPARPSHFFASYASDLPLPLRFSILRC